MRLHGELSPPLEHSHLNVIEINSAQVSSLCGNGAIRKLERLYRCSFWNGYVI